MNASVAQLHPYGGDVFPFRKSVVDSDSDSDSSDDLDGLMERVAVGSEHAFGQIYDQLSPMIYGLVLRVVRDPSLSEEVTQEIFLELWRTAPNFDRGRGNVRGWAATIAHRRAVDRVRSVDAARRRDNADADDKELVAPSAEESTQRTFEGERVRRELDRLTEAQREAITLAYYKGLTYKEVAVLLDLPEGTVKTRIRDGMIRLRDGLGVNNDD